MTANIFDQIEALSNFIDVSQLLENRYDNDVGDNPIYIGYSPYPNANPAMPVWYIQKVIYDGTAIVRRQQPDDGVKFAYVWDDRIDYFA